MIDLNLLYRMQLNNLSTSKLHEKTFTKFKNIYNHQKDIVIVAIKRARNISLLPYTLD